MSNSSSSTSSSSNPTQTLKMILSSQKIFISQLNSAIHIDGNIMPCMETFADLHFFLSKELLFLAALGMDNYFFFEKKIFAQTIFRAWQNISILQEYIFLNCKVKFHTSTLNSTILEGIYKHAKNITTLSRHQFTLLS